MSKRVFRLFIAYNNQKTNSSQKWANKAKKTYLYTFIKKSTFT